MKIRIASSKDEISTIENDEIVHFAFRPSNTDIFTLVQTCPTVKALHIPNSYNKRYPIHVNVPGNAGYCPS